MQTTIRSYEDLLQQAKVALTERWVALGSLALTARDAFGIPAAQFHDDLKSMGFDKVCGTLRAYMGAYQNVYVHLRADQKRRAKVSYCLWIMPQITQQMNKAFIRTMYDKVEKNTSKKNAQIYLEAALSLAKALEEGNGTVLKEVNDSAILRGADYIPELGDRLMKEKNRRGLKWEEEELA